MIKEVTIYKKTAICRNWWYTFKNVCNAAEFWEWKNMVYGNCPQKFGMWLSLV